jgi:hypothetical protein
MKTTNSRRIALSALVWIGRALAVFVFLFWGAFFVEHLTEWFASPFTNPPPAKVWLGQFLHLLILVGLLVTLRWEKMGCLLVMVAGLLFFPRAGANFPIFYALTILPALIVVLGRWAMGRIAPPPPAGA